MTAIDRPPVTDVLAPLRRHLIPIAVIHLVAASVMTGVIWTMQVVHYPLLAFVGEEAFVAYEAEHVSRIGELIALPWAVEGATALVLVAILPIGPLRRAAIAGVALMAVILVATSVWSAPAHAELAEGFDADVHRHLVSTNWVRTIAWTARAAIATWIAVAVVRGGRTTA